MAPTTVDTKVPQNKPKVNTNSLPDNGDSFAPTTDFDFYGKDLRKVEPDIAPVRETAQTTDAAPVREDRVNTVKRPDEIKTVADRIAAKLAAVQDELEVNGALREDSIADYNQEIDRLQAEYDAKKDKATKTAQDILRNRSNNKLTKRSPHLKMGGPFG